LMAEALFSVKSLKKVFPDGTEALRSVDLDIMEGEFLIVAGANGSGKTQLMRMRVGISDPTEGKIYFRGKPLKDSGAAVRKAVGLVFQDADAQIVGETVAEDVAFGPGNLKLPPAEIDRRVKESLAAMGLEHKADSPARRLSGGEKRRLAVAGILAIGCDALILDEPFANLDWPGVVQVLKILESLKESRKTVILLTHELEKVLALADRLVIISKGAVLDQGIPEEVLARLGPESGVRDPRRNYADVRDCTWLD